MHTSNKLASANIVQLTIDIVFMILAYFSAYLVSSRFTPLHPVQNYFWMMIVFVPLWTGIMAFSGMYNKTTFYYYDRIFRNVVFSSLMASLSLGMVAYFLKEINSSRLFMGNFLLISITIMLVERFIFGKWYRQSVDHSATNVILVCTEETRKNFYHYLSKTQIRYHLAGIIRIYDEEVNHNEELNVGKLENLDEILKERIVDEVIFSVPKNYTGKLEKYVRICEQMGITAHVVFNLYDLRLSHVRISMLGPLPMLTYHTVSLNPIQKTMKRCIDIAGSLVGIVMTIIIAIFIIPAIKLDSKGPVIFRQQRVGKNGRIFNIYKFRTMCFDAESKKQELMDMNEMSDGRMFKIKEDPRITRVGAFLRKTSLDEFPQFLNVLMGNMSLVGTRPPTEGEVDQYELEHWRRISIKPGLTGVWQVNGRSGITDFEEVVALDTEYIDTWSVWLDFRIIAKTVNQMFKTKSAY